MLDQMGQSQVRRRRVGRRGGTRAVIGFQPRKPLRHLKLVFPDHLIQLILEAGHSLIVAAGMVFPQRSLFADRCIPEGTGERSGIVPGGNGLKRL